MTHQPTILKKLSFFVRRLPPYDAKRSVASLLIGRVKDVALEHVKPMVDTFRRPFDAQLTGPDLVGVEIGVFKGYHSRQLVRLPSVKTLFCVDPYLSYDENGHEAYMQTIKDEAKRRLSFSDKVRWVHMLSHYAAAGAPMVDFVYIDGEHSRPSVALDVQSWWPRLKPGGIMGGHDYTEKWPGVIMAVSEFATHNCLQLHVCQPDWWVFKK